MNEEFLVRNSFTYFHIHNCMCYIKYLQEFIQDYFFSLYRWVYTLLYTLNSANISYILEVNIEIMMRS